MSAERPTFHESWYRVAELRPRIRSGVRVQRQHFRGRDWWVLRDPATNRFFRMNRAAWRLVGLLDGRRTVQAAWDLSNAASADDAPTQGETIGLLGQLYTADLVSGDLPPDAQTLLRRRRQRTEREWRGRLEQLLSVRIPIVDPDRVLGALAPMLAWLFTPVGLAVWLVGVGLGAAQLLGRGGRIAEQAAGLLDPRNLLPLYAATVIAKLVHELGHGIACKVLGRREGTGGEVHALGVMFLVFLPLPYIDATSAWGLRSKWARTAVGAAGMMAELLLASAAAFVWARAAEHSALSALAFNTIVVAGVSTVLFNANPLLRYDGYYMLSDLLEIPNLQQRARDTLHRVVKHAAWGVRRLPPPAATGAEAVWLGAYAVASGLYKVFVAALIVVFVSRQMLIVGALLALAAVVIWFLVPGARFIAYLARDPEIERERPRAVAVTLAVAALLLCGLALVPAPRSVAIPALAESTTLKPVAIETDGFLTHIAEPGVTVGLDDELVSARNREADAAVEAAYARVEAAEASAGAALTEDPALAAIARVRVDAEKARLFELTRRAQGLTVRAGAGGVWLPDPDNAIPGRFVPRGTRLGTVIDPRRHIIRCAVGQRDAAELIGRVGQSVRVRPAGRPDLEFAGSIRSVIEAGREPEPGERPAGAERSFEVIVEVYGSPALRHGQRCSVRVGLDPEPIGLRLWRGAFRALQKRTDD